MGRYSLSLIHLNGDHNHNHYTKINRDVHFDYTWKRMDVCKGIIKLRRYWKNHYNYGSCIHVFQLSLSYLRYTKHSCFHASMDHFYISIYILLYTKELLSIKIVNKIQNYVISKWECWIKLNPRSLKWSIQSNSGKSQP